MRQQKGLHEFHSRNDHPLRIASDELTEAQFRQQVVSQVEVILAATGRLLRLCDDRAGGTPGEKPPAA